MCFFTKAVNLAAVLDFSTESFLAAFYRFVSRRGCPIPCSSNFVGASRALKEGFNISINKIESYKIHPANIKKSLASLFQPALEDFGSRL